MSGPFQVEFINRAAQKEYLQLKGAQRELVDKGLARLEIRADEIGNPLSGPLKECRELKFRADGIRIVYRVLDGKIQIVEIVAIGSRDKEKVLRVAEIRLR